MMKTTLLQLMLVGMGGFLGSIGRYLLSGAVYRIFQNYSFPSGTAAVNILGCFIIGVGSAFVDQRQLLSPETRLFFFIGLLGGFTTFSTFGYETIALMRDGQLLSAGANVLIQVIFGLAAVFFGYGLTRYI
jgi:CrcB protein